MTTPAVPIASSSTIPTLKTRKPKKHKEKSRQGKAVSSSDADASATVETPAARNEENENENDDLGRVAVEELYAPVPPTGSISVMVAPEGSVLADTYDVEFGEFDYDTVKADDDGGGSGAELWLVRAPTAVKAKSLRGLEVSSSRMGLVGDLLLRKRSTAYDLWALEPTAAHASGNRGEDGRDELGGGTTATAAAHVDVCAEELSSLSVLLPCKRKGGKHYLAPKPVTRHLVIAARPPKPTTQPDAASDSAIAAAYQNAEREAYPEDVLTHRFRPYGDPGDPPPPVDHVDVVEITAEASTTTKEKERPKRKGGGETGLSKKKKVELVAF